MKFIKSQVIEFDAEFERNRVKQFYSPEQATPMFAVLDALEAGDLKAASDAYTSDVATRMPSTPYHIIKAYRDHIKDPDVHEHPKVKLTPPNGFTNPNNVNVQHNYALHVLANHRYMLAKLAVALQDVASEDAKMHDLVKQAVAALHGANGAEENDPFKLVEVDGKLAISLD